jgi:hypothetical protein
VDAPLVSTKQEEGGGFIVNILRTKTRIHLSHLLPQMHARGEMFFSLQSLSAAGGGLFQICTLQINENRENLCFPVSKLLDYFKDAKQLLVAKLCFI